MKLLLLNVTLFFVLFSTFGQVRQISDCSESTQRFITQYYTIDKQVELNDDPQALARLEYICARSYEFAPGQTILNAQKALFVVQRYEHMRRQNYRVTIFDDYSGLKVVLYSQDEVELEKVRIAGQFQLAKE